MFEGWNNIEVVSVSTTEKFITNPQVGENYEANVVIDTKMNNEKNIGIEMVISTDRNNVDHFFKASEMDHGKNGRKQNVLQPDFQASSGWCVQNQLSHVSKE